MIHPFLPSLKEKSLSELQESISSLTSKLTFAYRTHNQPLVNQLLMVIEGYKTEANARLDDIFKQQNIQATISVEKETK